MRKPRWNDDILAVVGGRHAIGKNHQARTRERSHRRYGFIFSHGCNESTDDVECAGNPRDSEGQAVRYLPFRVAAEQI